MKLIIAVVQDQDVEKLLRGLLEKGHSATKLASTGGFLREGNTTLLIGVEPEEVDNVLDVIREKCKKRKQCISAFAAMGKSMDTYIPPTMEEVSVGGGTVFVMDVERFEKI